MVARGLRPVGSVGRGSRGVRSGDVRGGRVAVRGREW